MGRGERDVEGGLIVTSDSADELFLSSRPTPNSAMASDSAPAVPPSGTPHAGPPITRPCRGLAHSRTLAAFVAVLAPTVLHVPKVTSN